MFLFTITKAKVSNIRIDNVWLQATNLLRTQQIYYFYDMNTLLEAVRHFRSVVIDAGSSVTTAHVHQCRIFQSYAKTGPSRMGLTMKLTMREPASMTTDTWSRRVTFYSNSV